MSLLKLIGKNRKKNAKYPKYSNSNLIVALLELHFDKLTFSSQSFFHANVLLHQGSFKKY